MFDWASCIDRSRSHGRCCNNSVFEGLQRMFKVWRHWRVTWLFRQRKMQWNDQTSKPSIDQPIDRLHWHASVSLWLFCILSSLYIAACTIKHPFDWSVMQREINQTIIMSTSQPVIDVQPCVSVGHKLVYCWRGLSCSECKSEADFGSIRRQTKQSTS